MMHLALALLSVTVVTPGVILRASRAPSQGPLQAPGPRVTRTSTTACASLTALQLPDVRITSTAAVTTPARGITVPYCKVEGVIGREIRFEVRLPDEWNQRFVMGGGGGFVGAIDNQAGSTVNLGYATAATDTGHEGLSFTAAWALNQVERQVNFGHVAVHRTTTVAKAIAAAYYAAPPRYSYFVGCSNGGRQGLMEAQRYPEDFDGIVAGAPALDFTRIVAAFVKNAQAVYPDPTLVTQPVITADNLLLLASRVLATCDAEDGVKDDVIDEPRACRFTVESLPGCADDRPGPQCVTRAQRAAIARIYAPAVAGGRTIYAGQPFGGEAERGGWSAWITGPHADVLAGSGGRAPALQWAFATEFAKYFIFADPSWSYVGYDLANWERDTRLAASFLNADNPDLSAFARRNGKLLVWHGWSDAALNARSTIDYYEQVLKRDAAMQASTRLFMLPGVQHCGGGAGPDRVDWLGALANWVERGQPPDRLIATKPAQDGRAVRTRPVCAYPQRAVHEGTGSTDEAERFVCRSR